jgi:phytoene synthase
MSARADSLNATPPQFELPAAGSSFYLAMRILEPEAREGMYAIYAFCRAVDDLADEDGPREERKAGLDAWRRDLARLYAGEAPGLAAPLAETVRRFGLKLEDFLTVIDGMAMDFEETIVAPDSATLDLYCERVASAVGRLSVRIFGMPEQPGLQLAHHLGRALQLTNILRDLDEDAERGRLYLAREPLERAGITDFTPAKVLADPRLGKACGELIAQAKAHFAASNAIMTECPRRSVRSPRLMAAAYAGILADLETRGFAPPRERVRTRRLKVLGALLRHGFAK